MSMTVNTKLSAADYIEVVNEISENYFSVEGKYEPHYGLFCAIGSFYNHCVVDDADSVAAFDGEINDLNDVDHLILNNEEVIQAFNEAIHVRQIALDFANAYRDAMDIVVTKKSSIGYLADFITAQIDKLTERANSVVTPENIDMLKNISNHLQNGTFNVDTLMETYKGSEMNRAARRRAKKDKVVPIK